MQFDLPLFKKKNTELLDKQDPSQDCTITDSSLIEIPNNFQWSGGGRKAMTRYL